MVGFVFDMFGWRALLPRVCAGSDGDLDVAGLLACVVEVPSACFSRYAGTLDVYLCKRRPFFRWVHDRPNRTPSHSTAATSWAGHARQVDAPGCSGHREP
jgi:hypothetical protein